MSSTESNFQRFERRAEDLQRRIQECERRLRAALDFPALHVRLLLPVTEHTFASDRSGGYHAP